MFFLTFFFFKILWDFEFYLEVQKKRKEKKKKKTKEKDKKKEKKRKGKERKISKKDFHQIRTTFFRNRLKYDLCEYFFLPRLN